MYFTKTELRQAARTSTTADAKRVLKEDAGLAKVKHTFDIFLCHASADADIVLGAKKTLESSGLTVYVDWIEDQVDHGKISRDNADHLRTRMRECASLIFLATQSAPVSVWMPWELGYFDGMGGNVAIFPVVDSAGEAFKDHQFLQLYPTVKRSALSGLSGRKDAIIMDADKATLMETFAKRRRA